MDGDLHGDTPLTSSTGQVVAPDGATTDTDEYGQAHDATGAPTTGPRYAWLGTAQRDAGATVVVLGAAYRGGVKETAFSGVFPTVDALRAAGATVLVHDPMYTDDELAAFGWTAFHRGDAADAVVVQADHAEYAQWTEADVLGVRSVVDGRRILNDASWSGTTFVSIGTARAGSVQR